MFQHTAARRRLQRKPGPATGASLFQHTAARRRLHSPRRRCLLLHCFNTQPPEGGCGSKQTCLAMTHWFQHTAARRRLRHGPRPHPAKQPRFNTQPPEGGCFPLTW